MYMVFWRSHRKKKSFFECLDKIVSVREAFGQVYIGKGRYILCDRIMYIKAIDKYVEIHTTDSVEIGYFSLKEIQSFLPKNGFKRVHRSYLVHFDYIAKIGTEIVMRDGSVVHPMRGTVKGLKKEYFEYVRSR